MKRAALAFLMVVVFVAIGYAAPIYELCMNAGTSTVYVVKEYSVIAINEQTLRVAGRLVVEKDYEALKTLLRSGMIVLAKPGVKVYVETVRSDGYVAIRPVGKINIFWTLSTAVEKDE